MYIKYCNTKTTGSNIIKMLPAEMRLTQAQWSVGNEGRYH